MSAPAPLLGEMAAQASPAHLPAMEVSSQTAPAAPPRAAGGFLGLDALHVALLQRLPRLQASTSGGERRMAAFLAAGATLLRDGGGYMLRLPDGASLWSAARAYDALLEQPI